MFSLYAYVCLYKFFSIIFNYNADVFIVIKYLARYLVVNMFAGKWVVAVVYNEFLLLNIFVAEKNYFE